MSWPEVFQVIGEELIKQFQSSGSLQTKFVDSEWFEVEGIYNPQTNSTHLISTSLFWKRDSLFEKPLPAITRKSMIEAESLGLAGRYAPWECYVLPIITSARILKKADPKYVFRVYLANDLRFLLEDLVAVGCEVYLMVCSSICHNPGAMWRFLALEGSDCPVTITDADRSGYILSDIARTEAAIKVGVGGWRVPYVYNCGSLEGYRPMSAAQFGSNQNYPIRLLMEAFIWQNHIGTISKYCTLFGMRETEIAGTVWPNYGFDEWFLLAVMYPRMAQEGLLTFVPWDIPSLGQFFALDIEYCTWANPKSELINYPNPEAALGDAIRPWAEWQVETLLKVRSETTVVKRPRRRIGAHHGIFSHTQHDGIENFPQYIGSLPQFLAGASANVTEPWFVDLNPQLHLSTDGGELFLDRRYEDCDVVFCGYYFIKIAAVVAEWARRNELDGNIWAEGKLLKVPKLEGPMTLWRTEFSKKFHEELVSQFPFVKPEILLRAWMDQGKVAFAEATAKQMGWRVR